MLLKSLHFENHPVVGNLQLDSSDPAGLLFNNIVVAGGNGVGKTVILEAIYCTFLGKLGQNIGNIFMQLKFDSDDMSRLLIAAPQLVGQVSSDWFRLEYYSHDDQNWNTAYRLYYQNTSGQSVQIVNVVMAQPQWHNVFRLFYNEASVSFSPGEKSSVTADDVDSSAPETKRSGSDIANRITQLLIDVRAIDAEELNNWVSANPGQVPPETVINKRLNRFSAAFDFMFPHKRFKEVKRSGGNLIVTFEQFGKENSIDELSTGEKQIVFRAGFLLRDLHLTPGSLVLIDEPELSLHPEWQANILNFYIKILSDDQGRHPQLISATHSPFIVHGAANAKITILQREASTGALSQMAQPVYPSIAGLEAVRAFNLDAFIAALQAPLLILVEGETDKALLELAWRHLRPGQAQPFELRAALGAKNINITLNDQELFTKLASRKILGVFDFDDAYDHWNGVWTIRTGGSTIISTDNQAGLIKRHSSNNGWAMLLPVPPYRSTYANAALKGKSIMSIESMFADTVIPQSMLSQKDLPMAQSLPYFDKIAKSSFVVHAATLKASDFLSFEPLLVRIEQILSGAI